MSERLSQGPVQVFGNTPVEINDAFRQIQDRLDEFKGLRGRTSTFDRFRVEDPTESKDAINLATGDARYVVPSGGRMTYGTESVIYTDINGTVLHGMGNF